VWASLVFKVFVGGLGCVPGFYLDQRGLAALLAIPTTMFSVGFLGQAIEFSVDPRLETRLERIATTTMFALMSALSAGATYGLIKLEKYFWQHEAQIKLELQTVHDKASDCKIFIEKLLSQLC
jgi:hypothetical protein